MKSGFLVLISLCLSITGLWVLSSFQMAQTLAQPAQPKPVQAQKKEEDRVKIFSDKAIYKKQEKFAQAIGRVKVLQDNTTIYADELIYYEDTKRSFVDQGVKIVQINQEKEKGRTTTITAEKMTAFHQEKRIFLEQDVRLDREAYTKDPPPQTYPETKPEKRKRTEKALKKSRSVITSDQMEYFTKSENANLVGNVVLLQKEKKVTGKKAFIRGEQDGDTITVEDDAKVVQINGDWLIKEKIIEPDPQDEEQERFLKEKLTMTGDKIILYQATDDMEVLGNVKITQKVGKKERVATGDEATYSDQKQLAILTGNVRIQRENEDWLTADKAIFYTELENFEAISLSEKQVESEFTMEDEENPKPPEPINPPLPEFDLDKHQPAPRLPAWLREGRAEPKRLAPATKAHQPIPTPSAGMKKQSQPKIKPPEKPRTKPTPIASSFTVEVEE